MRAFLCNSSNDKNTVRAVYDALKPESAWLDSAEIDVSDTIIEKLETAIEQATDFVIFWSQRASESPWVRFELNMAFTRHLYGRTIRIHPVRLDCTPLPLSLRQYRYLDVSESTSPVDAIVAGLTGPLSAPPLGVRHAFINRSVELGDLEEMLDDRNVRCISITGFAGIGKRSLVTEAFRRFYERGSRRDQRDREHGSCGDGAASERTCTSERDAFRFLAKMTSELE